MLLDLKFMYFMIMLIVFNKTRWCVIVILTTFGELAMLGNFIDMCREMPAQEILITNHCAVV